MANTGALLRFPCSTPASRNPHKPLEVRLLKPLLSNGLSAGTITRLEGRRSSGRTTLALQMLAEATQRGEVCAVVDTQDTFHPESATAAGVQLTRLVWIRCQGQVDSALRAVDLLLHAGGFGVIWLDLCEVSPRALQRIPVSHWHRFRRAIENTSTHLLVSTDFPIAKTSGSNHLQLQPKVLDWMNKPAGIRFLKTLVTVENHSGVRSQAFNLQVVV